MAKIQDLTGQLAVTYASETNGLGRLVAIIEYREQQAKEIVDSIEKEWAGVGEKAERSKLVSKKRWKGNGKFVTKLRRGFISLKRSWIVWDVESYLYLVEAHR